MSNSKWDDRLALIALHEMTGVGWQSIKRAVDNGELSKAPYYTELQWKRLGLRSVQAQAAVQAFALDKVQRLMDRYEQLGVQLITQHDELYPALLKALHEPPWVLYVKGRTELLRRAKIAVVGTRVPTTYGRQAASRIAAGLSHSGLAVVSGLARGIDRHAHEAALEGSGSTIAVLGTAIDNIYPPDNKALFRDIAERGLIVTEYPLGTPSHPGLFPKRNRIIAGLSFGTLVVEASARSGSLITADLALENSREVFAVPGPIYSPKSAGTNALIRNSAAKLVSGAEHIMEEFCDRSDFTSLLPYAARTAETASGMSVDEQRIYELLRSKAGTADELHELTGMPFGHLHAVLINLSIKRKIEQQPGFIYIAL
ncbi:DNA-protecting protein DprA [Paenibacillaceae bacterium]|nr:DNA-protecting protein DprA [Paenibacillaceae bacterium]